MGSCLPPGELGPDRAVIGFAVALIEGRFINDGALARAGLGPAVGGEGGVPTFAPEVGVVAGQAVEKERASEESGGANWKRKCAQDRLVQVAPSSGLDKEVVREG